MYERMTDKNIIPKEDDIKKYIGNKSALKLNILENMLKQRYDIYKELRFPFGDSYGWGYKYSHKTKHLFYLFFEKNSITATLQIGDKQVPILNELLPSLSEKTKTLWEKRYPCGKNGGWVHYRILTDKDLSDLIKLIEIRKSPTLNN